jgi:transposase-like protein
LEEITKNGLIFGQSIFFSYLRQQNKNVMALNLNKNLKLYYSIKEVAQMFGVNESTLRYWEQEFPASHGVSAWV